jgi:O-antigen/teichoic acid export membrane protein
MFASLHAGAHEDAVPDDNVNGSAPPVPALPMTAIDNDATQADDGTDSIGRNVAFSFAAQMVASAATAALTLYLVRALGVEEFGSLSIALGLGALILLPGDFGVSASAARFMAERRGEWPAVAAVLRNALRIKLVTSGVLATALFALADPIASAYSSAPGLAWALRGIAVVVFFQSFFMLFTAAFQALGRISLNLRVITLESLVEAAMATLLVLLGAGAAGAAFGRAIGFSAAVGFAFVLAIRLIGSQNFRRDAGAPSPVDSRRIFRYAGALLIIDGAYALLSPISTLLLGAFLNAAAVGAFTAPIRFIVFLHYPGYSIATGIAPRMARGEKVEPEVKALQGGLRWIILIQTVLVAPTVIWATPLVDLLLGSGYEQSAEVLAGLAPFTFMSGFAPLLSLSVNYLGEARRRVPIALATLAISVGLDVALIPQIGIHGATIATDAAYAFYVLGHFWICRSMLDLPLRPVARDLARALVAAFVMTGVLAAFGTSDLGAFEFVVGGAAGVLAYIAALLAMRAVTVPELRAARDAVAAKFGRRRPAAGAA